MVMTQAMTHLYFVSTHCRAAPNRSWTHSTTACFKLAVSSPQAMLDPLAIWWRTIKGNPSQESGWNRNIHFWETLTYSQYPLVPLPAMAHKSQALGSPWRCTAVYQETVSIQVASYSRRWLTRQYDLCHLLFHLVPTLSINHSHARVYEGYWKNSQVA